MSWHINKKGKSVIKEIIDAFTKEKNDGFIQIFTVDEGDFYIFDDDKCVVAEGFIYIQSKNEEKNKITHAIINIDKIVSIYMVEKNVINTE